MALFRFDLIESIMAQNGGPERVSQILSEEDNLFYAWAYEAMHCPGKPELSSFDVNGFLGLLGLNAKGGVGGRRGVAALFRAQFDQKANEQAAGFLKAGFMPEPENILKFCETIGLHPAFLIKPDAKFIPPAILEALVSLAGDTKYEKKDRRYAVERLEDEIYDFSRENRFFMTALETIQEDCQDYFDGVGYNLFLRALLSEQPFGSGGLNLEKGPFECLAEIYRGILDRRGEINELEYADVLKVSKISSDVVEKLRPVLFRKGGGLKNEEIIRNYVQTMEGNFSQKWDSLYNEILSNQNGPDLINLFKGDVYFESVSLSGETVMWPKTLKRYCENMAILDEKNRALNNLRLEAEHLFFKERPLAFLLNSFENGELDLYLNVLRLEEVGLRNLSKNIQVQPAQLGGVLPSLVQE